MPSHRPSPTSSTHARAGVALTVLGVAAAAWWVPSAGADDAPDGSGAASAAARRDLDGFTVTTSAAQVAVGDTVSMSVGADRAEDLYAFDLGVGFDPEVLAYVEDSAATELTGAVYDTAGAGRVDVVHTELGSSPAASGALTLITLTFTAVGVGDAGLVVDELTTVDTALQETTVAGAGTTSLAVVPRPVPTATPAPVAPPAAPVRTDLRVRLEGTRAGARPRVVVRVRGSGTVPQGRVTLRYEGAGVVSRKLRDGRVVRRLPARPAGDYRLAVVFEPGPGFVRDREVRTVRVRD